MSIATYEIRSSENCDDAPDSIKIDVDQFSELVAKVAPTLKELNMSYALRWFADAEYTLYEDAYSSEDPTEVEDVPHGYQQHLKIFADGYMQLIWRHKHDATCEFWVDLPKPAPVPELAQEPVPELAQEPVPDRIVIHIDGGLVQGVYSEKPLALDVLIADYDCYDEQVYVSGMAVVPNPEFVTCSFKSEEG